MQKTKKSSTTKYSNPNFAQIKGYAFLYEIKTMFLSKLNKPEYQLLDNEIKSLLDFTYINFGNNEDMSSGNSPQIAREMAEDIEKKSIKLRTLILASLNTDTFANGLLRNPQIVFQMKEKEKEDPQNYYEFIGMQLQRLDNYEEIYLDFFIKEPSIVGRMMFLEKLLDLTSEYMKEFKKVFNTSETQKQKAKAEDPRKKIFFMIFNVYKNMTGKDPYKLNDKNSCVINNEVKALLRSFFEKVEQTGSFIKYPDRGTCQNWVKEYSNS